MTNPSALLAVNMSPFIGTLSSCLCPCSLPGVPITHRASNPMRAFLNFREGSADESLDLRLDKSQSRFKGGGVRGDGVLFKEEEESAVVVLSSAHWCTVGPLVPFVPLTAEVLTLRFTHTRAQSHTHTLQLLFHIF